MKFYTENPKESSKSYQNSVSLARYENIKSIYKNHLYFFILVMNYPKMKLKKFKLLITSQ